jgi:hypothetical protein
MIYITFKMPDVAAGSGGKSSESRQKVPDFPWSASMKARSLPSYTMDLCGVFIKDQFSFIVTGNESAAIILQVVVVPSIFSLA